MKQCISSTFMFNFECKLCTPIIFINVLIFIIVMICVHVIFQIVIIQFTSLFNDFLSTTPRSDQTTSAIISLSTFLQLYFRKLSHLDSHLEQSTDFADHSRIKTIVWTTNQQFSTELGGQLQMTTIAIYNKQVSMQQ